MTTGSTGSIFPKWKLAILLGAPLAIGLTYLYYRRQSALYGDDIDASTGKKKLANLKVRGVHRFPSEECRNRISPSAPRTRPYLWTATTRPAATNRAPKHRWSRPPSTRTAATSASRRPNTTRPSSTTIEPSPSVRPRTTSICPRSTRIGRPRTSS